MSAPSTVSTRPTSPSGRATTPTGAPRPERPGTVRAALMVAEREVLAQIQSKTFLISTAVLLVGILASIVVGGIMAGRDTEGTKVAVVPATAQVVAGVDGLAGVDVDDEAAARALVREGEVEAAVVADEDTDPVGYRVIALSAEPTEIVALLSLSPEVEVLEPAATDEAIRYLVSFAFGFVFLMSAMGFGSTIAQNTVVEKQSRIVELLLAAVSSRALLAGKILGNSALAFAQTAAIAAISVAGIVATGQQDLLQVLGAPLVWFVVFFLVGFILLAALFAASASLVSRMEDVGSVMSPVTMLTMIPYFGVVFFNDNETVLRVMSYVPFSAPVAMPVRLFLGETAWWEPLLALLILAVTTVGVIAVGGRIYERSLLRTGPRVKLREVLTSA